jgi:5-methylcytosine-specific restriction enzyme A
MPGESKTYAGSVAAMSTSRTMHGGFADRNALKKGNNQRALCRWCSLEVPPRRFTFCSEYCVHEWKLRTDPGYLREHVRLRDHGICAQCGVNTQAAYGDLKRSRGTQRMKLLAHWGLKRISRKSLWDADHIVPVSEGGGECDLANLRTLCLACHRLHTAELQKRLRAGKCPETRNPARGK